MTAVVVAAAATGAVVHWVDSGATPGNATTDAAVAAPAAGVPGAGPTVTLPPAANSASEVQSALGKIEPSVVIINDTMSGGGRFDPFGGFEEKGAGTGIVIGANGEVVTNAHVVNGATDIRVTLPGKGQHSASVVGINPTADLAVLKVSGVSGLTPADFANSDTVKVGDPVFAVGNAEGYGGKPSVSEGIVSALGRSLSAGGGQGGSESLSGLIQTDASVNPGNSGGPLIDADGDVIGIVTAMATGDQQEPAQGIGFAIPSNTVLSHLPALKAGQGESGTGSGPRGSGQSGTVAYLGVEIGDGSGGAIVAAVVGGGPAAKAGVRPGDVVTALDGKQIGGAEALVNAVHGDKPGQKITLTIRRDSKTMKLSVTLGSTSAASESGNQPQPAIPG